MNIHKLLPVLAALLMLGGVYRELYRRYSDGPAHVYAAPGAGQRSAQCGDALRPAGGDACRTGG